LNRLIVTSLLVCVSFLAAPVGWTADFPAWSVRDTCLIESDAGVCLEFEARARRQLAGQWETLPSQRKERCLAATASTTLKSFRVLKTCLDGAETQPRAFDSSSGAS
jgi:hypothetical protein